MANKEFKTKRVLSIIGPTATGKTSLALKLAESFLDNKSFSKINIISADSRQVYKGLEITTGADIPDNYKKTPANKNLPYEYWQNSDKNIFIHGVAIINIDEEWSVAHFKNLAEGIINQSDENQLTIIVGGTGLYHRHVFNNDPHLDVKPNLEIRKKAEKLSVSDLKKWLKKENPKKLSSMNNSDKNNPRRLIRALEISAVGDELKKNQKKSDHKYLMIGLHFPINEIEEKIKQRVLERIDAGAIEEIKKAKEKNRDENLPALSSTGVAEMLSFLEVEIDNEELVELWTRRELQYAKRQITWIKSQENIIMFSAKYNISVITEEVQKWLNNTRR